VSRAPRRVSRFPALAVLAALAAGGCGAAAAHHSPGAPGNRSTTPAGGATTGSTTPTGHASTRSSAPARPRPAAPPYPQLLPAATGTGATPFVPAVRWRGQTAVWVARTDSGVALLSFDQRLTELHLHSGTVDGGTLGWRYGPQIAGAELHRVIAAFNGGFRFSTGAGGFEAFGRVAVPLRAGAGSIVTYADGRTDVGSWRQEVPAAGQTIASVRQNLTLLIDHGIAAPNLDCQTCWGATLGGINDPARSALGITADGKLIWAAGEHLTVSDLVAALGQARVVRAVELDINPEWVAGYLYAHRGPRGPVQPVPVLAAQQGIPGQYLSPWSRDFFSVTAR
jgi:hypothetical protein